MKKIIKSLLAASMICCLVGCSKPVPKVETIHEIIYPNSFIEFNGMTPEQALESCENLGENFCEDVKIVDEGILIKFTDKQINDYIDKNEERINDTVNKFLLNNNYDLTIDEKHKKISLYFDENIDDMMLIEMLVGVVAKCGENYILKNNDLNWSYDIEIYNCHTNKLVVSGTVPEPGYSFSDKDWERSYEVD